MLRMPVWTMPPESCTAQSAMPATVSTAPTPMPTVRPFPPLRAEVRVESVIMMLLSP